MISDASAYFCAVQQNLQTREDEEPTELITALVNHHHHDNKTKKKKKKDQTHPTAAQQRKKVSCEPSFGWEGVKKKRNLQGHTTEVASSKSFYPRCPWEEPQQNSCNGKPWLLMKGFAWRRGGERLDREESQLFSRWKAKSPGGAAPWCVGHIKIFDRLQHYEKTSVPPFFFPPTTDLSHSHQAPWLARVIVWALRVQSGPFRSRSVCADTM